MLIFLIEFYSKKLPLPKFLSNTNMISLNLNRPHGTIYQQPQMYRLRTYWGLSHYFLAIKERIILPSTNFTLTSPTIKDIHWYRPTPTTRRRFGNGSSKNNQKITSAYCIFQRLHNIRTLLPPDKLNKQQKILLEDTYKKSTSLFLQAEQRCCTLTAYS
jgi:hypothetical protein